MDIAGHIRGHAIAAEGSYHTTVSGTRIFLGRPFRIKFHGFVLIGAGRQFSLQAARGTQPSTRPEKELTMKTKSLFTAFVLALMATSALRAQEPTWDKHTLAGGKMQVKLPEQLEQQPGQRCDQKREKPTSAIFEPSHLPQPAGHVSK
jgi:hypothetical protein